jgi:DNA (cytosine-5)-methyltransferase 1
MNQFTFIDIFAGTSALSEGFIRNGFIPVAHIEMDSDACNTIKTRIAYHYLKNENKLNIYRDYLLKKQTREELYTNIPNKLLNSVINKEISDNTITEIFNQIDVSMSLQKHSKVDFLIGGPPCQAFSLLSRHRKNIENDPRCYLYIQYGEFLKRYNPIGFVFENVLGLLSAKNNHFENIKKHFKDLGYTTDYIVLNASDFGVLQNRKRIIIFGWREKDFNFGLPTIQPIKNNWTADLVFNDLPKIKAGEEASVYVDAPNEYLKTTNIRTNDDILTLHIARPLNEADALKYKFAVEKLLKEKKRISYLDFPQEYQTMKNKESFLDRFKVVDKNGKSHTIVAHIAKDGHYYIYPYLDTIRSISVREAARLQSFPDNFFFEGSRTSMFKQIGNAVPPLMAESIAKSLNKILCQ